MSYMKNKIINKKYVIVSLLSIIFFITGCTFGGEIKYIGKNLEINVDKCKIERSIDTHGGFLGDGDYFAKLVCTDWEDSEIKSKWKPLPLHEELQKVMDTKWCGGDGCNDVYKKYNIPYIENGFYYFIDRYSEAEDRKSEEKLNERVSYNFSVGIYDIDNKVLYYYELDT